MTTQQVDKQALFAYLCETNTNRFTVLKDQYMSTKTTLDDQQTIETYLDLYEYYLVLKDKQLTMPEIPSINNPKLKDQFERNMRSLQSRLE